MVKPKGSEKKKRISANAPKKVVATFGKKKVRIGHVLKHDNATDTRVQTRKVILVEQLKSNEASNSVLTQRGLNIEDLCRRLGHYNENTCREAVIGAEEVFSKHPERAKDYLRIIMPSIGHRITNGMKSASTRSHLMALLKIIFESCSEVFHSHFSLFSCQVLAAFMDSRQDIREFSFEVLSLLMAKFPALCAGDRDIFDKYLLQMGNGRISLKPKALGESISLFASVYSKLANNLAAQIAHAQQPQEIRLSFAEEKCTPLLAPILPPRGMLEFPVIYTDQQHGGANFWEELCHRVLTEKLPNNNLFWRELQKWISRSSQK